MPHPTSALPLTLSVVLLTACGEPSGPVSNVPEAPQLRPAVDIESGWVWFEMADVGAEVGGSTSYDVRVKNGGLQDLVISDISIDGRDPDRFTIGEITPASRELASMETLTVPVTFEPTAAGVAIAWLRFTSNAENFPSIGFLVVGPARDPELPASDAAIAPLATSYEVTTSVGEPVALYARFFNVGNAPLRLDAFTIVEDAAGAFAIGTDTPEPPVWLAEGDHALVTVIYNPGTAGSHTATLRVAGNDPASPVLDVALSGTAE